MSASVSVVSAVSACRLAVCPEDVVSIAKTGQPALRRLTREQGRALEVLGHAVEYLIDSRLHDGESREAEAIEVLKRVNRKVFLGAKVIVPLRRRLQCWLGV